MFVINLFCETQAELSLRSHLRICICRTRRWHHTGSCCEYHFSSWSYNFLKAQTEIPEDNSNFYTLCCHRLKRLEYQHIQYVSREFIDLNCNSVELASSMSASTASQWHTNGRYHITIIFVGLLQSIVVGVASLKIANFIFMTAAGTNTTYAAHTPLCTFWSLVVMLSWINWKQLPKRCYHQYPLVAWVEMLPRLLAICKGSYRGA